MFVSAGSASTQATSPCASSRSSASTSFHSTTRVVSASGDRRPDVALARDDAAVLERRERLVDRAVVAPVEDEDLRPPGELAREPDREAVRVGRGQRELPARRGRSGVSAPRRPRARPRSAASCVIPRAACSATARTVGSGEWPVIAAVSPRQKSTYSCPSTSRKRAPCASAAKTGKPPGQRIIHGIGTPERSERRALRRASSRERGCSRSKRSSSRSRRASTLTGAPSALAGRPSVIVVLVAVAVPGPRSVRRRWRRRLV